MLLAEVHPSVIQRHGRRRSDSWRRFIDEFQNPAIRLLATSSLPQRGARSLCARFTANPSASVKL